MTMAVLEDDAQQQGNVATALTSLQPIRDLAKNWDIDIASCLEEYLHDLVGNFPAADCQAAIATADTLNFTQAAMVLQNSSNIYSRKVEYLYALVYQALDELATGADAANKRGGKNATADADLDDFHAFDPHQEFLLLDDVLPVDETDDCHKINMPNSTSSDYHNGDGNRSMYHMNQTARLSLGGDMTAATSNHMDRSVQAMNEAAHRALIGSLDTGSLRLVDGRCDIDESGVLLMPGTASQRSAYSSQEPLLQQQQTDDDFPAGGGGGGGGDNYDYEEHDNDGDGFAFGEDGDEPLAPTEPLPESDNKRVTFAETVKPKERRADPWELLDPHSQDGLKARPLRIGKTIKLPPGVQDLPSECVTGTRTRRVSRKKKEVVPPALVEKQTRSLATETFKATLAARKRTHNETTLDDDSLGGDGGGGAGAEEETARPLVPLKGLVFGDEFAYIAKATAKRKAAERRERRKQQLQTSTMAPIEEEHYDEDDGFGGMDDGDDNDDFGGGGGDPFEDNGPVMGNTGMVSVDEVYRHNEDLDDSNPDARTFEDLCRAHIQKFAKGAEKYASETQLSVRVGQWQDKLGPLLEEEEERPEFDIHAYGQTVIDSMEQEIRRLNPKTLELQDAPVKVVDFRRITRHCQQYEVCRMFLASLSLSNSGNVEIDTAGATDCKSLQLELVQSDIDRPMETYLAPSAAVEGIHSLVA